MDTKSILNEDLRNRLKILLDVEGLESPEQLVGFDETNYRGISSWELYQRSLNVSRDRKRRYQEYDRMDEDADIKSSLDAYADEATVMNRERERTIWVTAEDQQVEDIIHGMFDRVKLEDLIWGIARATAKYGDDFEQIIYDDQGVKVLKYIEPTRIDRYVDQQNRMRGYKVEGAKASFGLPSGEALADPWDFLHFRIHGVVRDGWGESMLLGVMKIFRMLEQLETSLALYRLYRAADRNVFYIDVGTAATDQAYSIVERWRQTYRKRRWFQNNGGNDQGGGAVDFKHNPIDIVEDIFWPVRKESQSRVEKLQGSNNVGDIADIEYFRNKLRNGLGIPPEYFGSTEGTGSYNAAAGLAAQDMRFARKVIKLQRAIMQGVTKLCQYHLAFLEIDPSQVNFVVRMEPLSYLQEMQKNEAFTSKIVAAQGIVQMALELGMNPQGVAEFVFKRLMFSNDDDMTAFFQEQEEAVADAMQQQQDQQNQQFDSEQKMQKAQTQSMFAKAKAGATNAARTPNTGGKGKTSAKPKRSTKAESLNESDVQDMIAFLKANRKQIQEIKKDKAVFSDPDSIVEVAGK